ncbi:MAG: Na(+)-translocating NADH-quinone reductase subunit C, partial [Myxococcota bacterium]
MGRSTGYIIGFAVAICLACSIVVAGSAVMLKERQEDNKVLDRQKKVLDVAGLLGEGSVSAQEVNKLFKDNITARAV